MPKMHLSEFRNRLYRSVQERADHLLCKALNTPRPQRLCASARDSSPAEALCGRLRLARS